MQIKKDDIRQDIIHAASHEFATKGYSKASLRTIAANANTTLGNIYNYFPSKEALLDEIVSPVPDQIRKIIDNHNNDKLLMEVTGITSVEELKQDLDKYILELVPLLFPLDVLLSEPFIILVEGCEGTKYEKVKEELIVLFSAHIANHLNLSPTNQIATIFTKGSLAAIMIIAKSKKSMADKIQDFKTYLITLTYGFPSTPSK